MKKTLLKDCYCAPENEEEWKALDSIHGFNIVGEEKRFREHQDIVVYEPEGLYQSLLRLESRDIKKIPVSKFIDLLEDRIVGWRLEEIGFQANLSMLYWVEFESFHLWYWPYYKYFTIQNDAEKEIKLNINTFTELEQQLKFLGYETNAIRTNN